MNIKGKRERERDRDRETDRQTDRQRDRQTKRQTDRQRDRDRDSGLAWLMAILFCVSIRRRKMRERECPKSCQLCREYGRNDDPSEEKK